jgi:sarcosine oxidase subunit beta
MFSQRGVLHLAHTVHDLHEVKRRLHANRLNGVDSEFLTPAQIKRLEPLLNTSRSARYPILGASLQRRGGTARHDAVAWGYARGADAQGVDIIQNCEVTGIRTRSGKVEGVETTRGPIRCAKLAAVPAGHSSVIAGMAGFRLPIESFPLQALVSEPVKPCVNTVIMSNAVHGYISQSDKGELVIGAGTDQFTSYSQRGSFHVIEHTLQAIVELFPAFSRMKMLRQWGGVVDVTPDRSPIIGRTPIENMFINCGWGTGGFKATPGSGHVFAWTVAKGEPHPIAAPFGLERFTSGQLVDEHGAAAVAH